MPLAELMISRRGSVDPAKHLDEKFDLYSVPAYDSGVAEVTRGASIGSQKQLVESGDVLLCRIVPHIRRAWVVGPKEGRRQIASGEWIVFRSKKADPRYLRHVFVSDQFHGHFMNTVAGVGGSLLRARSDFVKQIKVPLPSLEEQRRVAEVLDRADDLLEKRCRALRALDRLNQSIFLEMFGDPVRNPHRFASRPLEELIDPERKVTYGIVQPGPHVADGVPYVRVMDMTQGSVRMTGLPRVAPEVAGRYKRSSIRQGDVLLSIRGGVGKVAIVPAGLDGANLTQGTARLAVVDAASRFVAEALRTPGLQRWMKRREKGVAITGISLGDVKQIAMITPPRGMQDEFQHRVNQVDRLSVTAMASSETLRELHSSLESRAFTGVL